MISDLRLAVFKWLPVSHCHLMWSLCCLKWRLLCIIKSPFGYTYLEEWSYFLFLPILYFTYYLTFNYWLISSPIFWVWAICHCYHWCYKIFIQPGLFFVCCPGLTSKSYVAQDDLEFQILLSPLLIAETIGLCMVLGMETKDCAWEASKLPAALHPTSQPVLTRTTVVWCGLPGHSNSSNNM